MLEFCQEALMGVLDSGVRCSRFWRALNINTVALVDWTLGNSLAPDKAS